MITHTLRDHKFQNIRRNLSHDLRCKDRQNAKKTAWLMNTRRADQQTSYLELRNLKSL